MGCSSFSLMLTLLLPAATIFVQLVAATADGVATRWEERPAPWKRAIATIVSSMQSRNTKTSKSHSRRSVLIRLHAVLAHIRLTSGSINGRRTREKRKETQPPSLAAMTLTATIASTNMIATKATWERAGWSGWDCSSGRVVE